MPKSEPKATPKAAPKATPKAATKPAAKGPAKGARPARTLAKSPMRAVAKGKDKPRYHHGNLREALLQAALEIVRERGASEVSLREVARRAGVSHAAPAHPFGDKAGLLTALAIEGFKRFAEAQRTSAERGGSDPLQRFSWLGYAYVMFAAENRAYFEVMFRPDLLRKNDADLINASLVSYLLLRETVTAVMGGSPTDDELSARVTIAWAQAHGLATLWLDGNLGHYAGLSDLDGLARQVFGLPAVSVESAS